ncbi:MAG: DUF1573 domain-containing protein, partial [candidate division Zixibacteria bacterium]|nr:DUF1573 domain-containing protein [candidate division Zixibacteria bacterium]
SHVFRLTSAGDDSLLITKVIPGCGCTQAPLEKAELAPGETTNLEIIFSTKRYSNRVTKSPRIETNEGSPHKNVHITSNVVTRPDSTYPVIVKPYKLDVSQFGEAVRDEMTFTLINVAETPLAVKLISHADTFFDIELPSEIPAGGSVSGTLKVLPDALGDSFEKSFTFELNDEQNSRFTVPVKRTVRTPPKDLTSK